MLRCPRQGWSPEDHHAGEATATAAVRDAIEGAAAVTACITAAGGGGAGGGGGGM